MNAIDLHALTYRWAGDRHDCLHLPDLHVAAGERVFLHGPSGSGKSTLLALLAGVLVPTGGQAIVQGQDLAALPGSRRDRFRVDHLGIIFQQFNLIPYLPVLDNVMLPCRFSARRRSRCLESPDADARRLLAHLDIDPGQFHRAARGLSVGQQQRVAAARALIGRPEIVIADEPTSALDAARQQVFIELLMRECADSAATLVFVSHDIRLAQHFDHVLSMAELNLAGVAA